MQDGARRPEADLPSWDDVDMRFQRGSGPGGQNRNKVSSCVTLVHRPTGITVRIDGRDQHANRAEAWRILCERVRNQAASAAARATNSQRRQLVGSGERGDKVRTYRESDDRVTDHRSGRVASLARVRQGRLDLLGAQ